MGVPEDGAHLPRREIQDLPPIGRVEHDALGPLHDRLRERTAVADEMTVGGGTKLGICGHRRLLLPFLNAHQPSAYGRSSSIEPSRGVRRGRAPAGAMRGIRQIGRAHVELQSLMRISYAVFCLKKKNKASK